MKILRDKLREIKRRVLKKNKSNLSLTGFTLIELILSIAIMGIVLLTVFSSFSLGLKVFRRAKDKTNLQVMDMFDQLGRQLRSANIFSINNEELSFKAGMTSMDFITTASLKEDLVSAGKSDLQKVKYYLTQYDNGNGRVLVYDVGDIFEKKKIKSAGDKGAFKRETKQDKNLRHIVENVKSLTFTYYDGAKWKNSWSSSQELPQAVSISLVIEDALNNTGRKEFSTIIDIACKNTQ